MRAGRQPDVVVLNSGMWELPAVLKGRKRRPGQATSTEESAAALYASRLPAVMQLFSPVGSGGGGGGGVSGDSGSGGGSDGGRGRGDLGGSGVDSGGGGGGGRAGGGVEGGGGRDTTLSEGDGGGCGFTGRLIWRQTFDSNKKGKDNTLWTTRHGG